MTATITRLVCRIRGHEWLPVWTPCAHSEVWADTADANFTIWTQADGGEQLRIVDGHSCKRCGLTIWEDAE